MPKPSVVILAGGLGTRIRHLLDGQPKPLAPVAGKPFLEWVIRYYARQGLDNFILSAGYRSDLIEEFCRSLNLPGLRVRCVAEPSPLGTAGGFCHAATTGSSESWLVCNGDSLVCADLAAFLTLGADDPEDARLLALKVTDASRYGNLAVDERGLLTSFNEKAPGCGLINAGVYLLRSRLLARFPSQRPLSFETDVFPMLLKENARIRVAEVAAPFIDIGTESSLREAEAFIIQNQEHFI